jgi:hypothetical protein
MLKVKDRRESVSQALQQVEAAEKNARDLIQSLYPPGEAVSWEKGGHIQYGTVVRNSSFGRGDRFFVRNDSTCKEYWITFYDINFAARQRSN